jgi:hypothetical protein
MNYARRISKHVNDRTVVFFEHAPPMPPEHYSLWAFWRVPLGAKLESFAGHLIGESPDLREQRMTGNKKQQYRNNIT